jgi:purine-binding chemotaxis protein CheW
VSTAAQDLQTIGTTQSIHENQYLTFILGDEEYGVDILRVQEIRGWDSVTSIPNSPHFIKGVINLRGTVVPIVDLRARFGMDPEPYNELTVVTVLRVRGEGKDRIMGVVVDAVSEVYHVPEEQIKPAPDVGYVINMNYIKGIATVEDKMLVILNIDQLMSLHDLDQAAPTEH